MSRMPDAAGRGEKRNKKWSETRCESPMDDRWRDRKNRGGERKVSKCLFSLLLAPLSKKEKKLFSTPTSSAFCCSIYICISQFFENDASIIHDAVRVAPRGASAEQLADASAALLAVVVVADIDY